MKIWFSNFCKTFYSPSAIIDMKYNKWYWNILFVFIFTLTYSGIAFLFFLSNSWNMSNIVALGATLPNVEIKENGVMEFHMTEDFEEGVEIANNYSYMSGIINVKFMYDPNLLSLISEEIWGVQNVVSSNQQDIETQIDQLLVDKMKIFLGSDSILSIETLDIAYHDLKNNALEKNQLTYNTEYTFTFKYNSSANVASQSGKLNFKVVKNKEEISNNLNSNYFIFNKTNLVFSTTNYNDYFIPIPYNESGITNLNFANKKDWKKMINFFMDVTKYEWLPLTALILYLTILAYVLIYILLFGFILWLMTMGAKQKNTLIESLSIITYTMNLPAFVSILVSMIVLFNILIGFMILTIGSLLFSFLVIFIYFRGSLKNKEKHLF